MDSDKKLIRDHSFRLDAALDLLEPSEPLERIMLRRLADGFDCHVIS